MLGISGTIGALPVEVGHSALFEGRKGRIGDSLAVGRPDRARVRFTAEGQTRQSVAFPLVHPNVHPLAVPDLQGQTLPVGGERRRYVGTKSFPQGCELALTVHPVDGDVLNHGAASDIDKVSALRKGELRPASGGIRDDAIKDWGWLASYFQALEVERHGKERAFVHVDQVARRQVPRVKAATLHRLPLPGSHRI